MDGDRRFRWIAQNMQIDESSVGDSDPRTRIVDGKSDIKLFVEPSTNLNFRDFGVRSFGSRGFDQKQSLIN